jgi:hypothetical protein
MELLYSTLQWVIFCASYARCFACRVLKKEKKAAERERQLKEKELAEKEGQPWPTKRKRLDTDVDK